MGRRVESKKQQTSSFFFFLNPPESSLRQRTFMVLHKHSNRPDHDCIRHFNLLRAQTANLVFHQSSSDAAILYEHTPASALDTVVTLAAENLFERNPSSSPTSIKPEATLGERIDFRISGQTQDDQE